jgi:hypothetical protein
LSWDGSTRATPQTAPSALEEYRRIMVGLAGPVLFAIGVWLGSSAIADRIHFDGAPHVSAVVVSVDYLKPSLQEDVSAMDLRVLTDEGPKAVVLADPSTAPNGLSAGAKVIVLFDPQRSSEAIFPSQLGWGKLLPGLGFTVFGAVATVVGVVTIANGIRRSRAAE